MVIRLLKDGVFVCNLFPSTDEQVDVIREQHPRHEGWEVRVVCCEAVADVD